MQSQSSINKASRRDTLHKPRKQLWWFTGCSPPNKVLDPNNSTVLAGDRIVEVDEDDDLCKNLVVNSFRARMEQAFVNGFLNNSLEDLVPQFQ